MRAALDGRATSREPGVARDRPSCPTEGPAAPSPAEQSKQEVGSPVKVGVPQGKALHRPPCTDPRLSRAPASTPPHTRELLLTRVSPGSVPRP